MENIFVLLERTSGEMNISYVWKDSCYDAGGGTQRPAPGSLLNSSTQHYGTLHTTIRPMQLNNLRAGATVAELPTNLHFELILVVVSFVR